MSVDVYVITADFGDNQLQLINEGEFGTVGSVHDLLPQLESGDIKSIVLTRESVESD